MKKKKNNGYNTPAPIEPWQVDAFLDGIYDEQVEKYIIEHGEAALQMAAIKDFDERMTALLYRVSCPEPDALLNYQWGLLDEEESVLIATHIAECAECQVEAMALAAPVAVTEKPSLTAVIKGKLPALDKSLRTFIGRLIPEEQMLVPAIRSAAESPDLIAVDAAPSFYVNFLFPDLEVEDPNGFSSNHIYAIAKATKETAVKTTSNLYLIKPDVFAPQSATSFADFDWPTQEIAIFYIKKAKPRLADPADLTHLYHIDVVEKPVLSTHDPGSYYTIIPIDSLMSDYSQLDDEYNAYRIMKLTANLLAVPTLPKSEKFALFPAVDIPFEKDAPHNATNKPTSKQMLFTVEELGLDIILTQVNAPDGDYRLEGQVLGGISEAVCKVTLIHDKAVVKTVALTPSGTFTFDKLDQAQYWLCFYGNGVEVCLAVI